MLTKTYPKNKPPKHQNPIIRFFGSGGRRSIPTKTPGYNGFRQSGQPPERFPQLEALRLAAALPDCRQCRWGLSLFFTCCP